ncbi:acyl-CoA dehydrogenase [Streptomyces sp. NPDC099050]|uniref:acyl-CoA dehydrogenase n=1 Tax=Streptomyces sp. NPDC099050 TaxID=3366100 RepID=UPI0038309FF4
MMGCLGSDQPGRPFGAEFPAPPGTSRCGRTRGGRGRSGSLRSRMGDGPRPRTRRGGRTAVRAATRKSVAGNAPSGSGTGTLCPQHSPAPAWNACSGVARDAAFAHCEAEGYRSMLDGAARGETPEVCRALELLTLHHGLGLLARHGDWYLAEQLITPAQWRLVHAGIEEADQELARYGTALVDAFGLDGDFLQVPIAHDGGEDPSPERDARPGAAQERVPC